MTSMPNREALGERWEALLKACMVARACRRRSSTASMQMLLRTSFSA